ncbi:glutaredoxin [bacterium BMS3Abin07]|nr:glutaredoxin [bacterium BMS3Abin07]GBE33431.1 glutaredoxin [bacterium BMS3Bbin05]
MGDGERVVLFALSTCNACRKTKKLLKKYDVECTVVDLDTVDLESRNKLLEKMRKYNPRETFPTLIIDGGRKVVVGYGEEEIKEALDINQPR